MQNNGAIEHSLKKSTNLVYRIVVCGAWTLTVVSYYFQFPFVDLSTLIVPAFATYFLLSGERILHQIDKESFLLWLLLALYLTGNLFVKISFLGVSDTSWRFYFILLIIPICFFLRNESFFTEYRIFHCLSICKVLFLIGMALYMLYVGSYEPFRIWARTMGGDMYFVYDFFPRIQLQGNALLLVAFLMEFARSKRLSVCLVLFFVGIVIEGNFSFYLAVATFLGFYFIKYVRQKEITIKKIFSILMALAVGVGFFFYSLDQGKQKADGGNALRAAQAEILLSGNPFVGEGVGAKVYDNVRLGRTADDKYYELQTLYIFFQIGSVGLLLFYLSNVLALRRVPNTDAWYIYVAYLIGSFFNPYCFDVTQMLTATLCGNYIMIEKSQH
jgi:putative wzy